MWRLTQGHKLARLKGFEPLTRSLEGCRSVHLSYRRQAPNYSTPDPGRWAGPALP